MEQLAAYDRYLGNYHSFAVHGNVILIENDLLADALDKLSQESWKILRMYWFLDMSDREIGSACIWRARRSTDVFGNPHFRMDEELRRRLETEPVAWYVSTGRIMPIKSSF